MAITAPTIPDTTSVSAIMAKLEGSALDNLMENGQTDWTDKITVAAEQLKFDLRNKRDIDSDRISTVDSDGDTNHVQADINYLNALLALALIYEDNVENVDATSADQYIRKADKYTEQYKQGLDTVKLDYDIDDSGDIDASEEDLQNQVRMRV